VSANVEACAKSDSWETAAPIPAPIDAGALVDLSACTILLAEDNEPNRRLALAMLGRFGLTADTARNGKEAVELATSKHYDLILMDCQMPVMDGFQAALKIRDALGDEADKVCIVALTANAMKEDQERCEAAGMDGYLSKPYSVAQMEATLRQWLRPPEEPRA